MPPTITTTRLASRKRVSSPGDSDWNVAPMMPAIPASPAPKPNTARNTQLDAHAGSSQHLTIVDARTDQHAKRGAVQNKPHRDADHDCRDQDPDAHGRVAQPGRPRRVESLTLLTSGNSIGPCRNCGARDLNRIARPTTRA